MLQRRRLLKEYREIAISPEDGVVVTHDDDLFRAQVELKGLPDSPYEGGTFHFHLDFPPDYPFKPPKLHISTQLFHPKVYRKTICNNCCPLSLLENWSPAYTTALVAQAIRREYLNKSSEMDEVNCSNRHDASVLYVCNKKQFDCTAKLWTRLYAGGSPIDIKIYPILLAGKYTDVTLVINK
jgi:ubiquitin-protein ligase